MSVGTAVVVAVIAGVTSAAAYWSFVQGRLRGIRETLHEVSRGVSGHYEHDGKPIPERIDKCIDNMKAQVKKARGASAKCRAYAVHFYGLGATMGEGCWRDGYKIGYAMAQNSTGNVEVDSELALTLRMTGCTEAELSKFVRDLIPVPGVQSP